MLGRLQVFLTWLLITGNLPPTGDSSGPLVTDHSGTTEAHIYESTYEPEPAPPSHNTPDIMYFRVNHGLQTSRSLGENCQTSQPREYSCLNSQEPYRMSVCDRDYSKQYHSIKF